MNEHLLIVWHFEHLIGTLRQLTYLQNFLGSKFQPNPVLREEYLFQSLLLFQIVDGLFLATIN